ncbi:hypothetical protein GCM10017774_32200 [Lentzea cavernae]|uniref:Uncharacterized protein n=2 Tax=Lentzea cavernae TaxID=2020703 RepID=A0ABQ3MFN7_9PSEU|nr:hypothetical protein GCM10017774_32200 [Lentzea cavernae]
MLRDYGSDARQGDFVEFSLDGEQTHKGVVMLLRSVGEKLHYVVQEEATWRRHEIPAQRIASVLERHENR